MRNFLAALFAIVLTFGSGVAARADSCPAANFVKSAGQAYDRAATSGSVAAFAAAADRFSDIRALSLFALGRYRSDLPKAREAEYLRLTRDFIGGILKDHGRGFRGGDLQVLDCTGSTGDLTVTTRASNGSKIVFRLGRQGGNYTVKDVNMQGVWLAQQMRSTFVGTINRTGSIDGLFKWLRS